MFDVLIAFLEFSLSRFISLELHFFLRAIECPRHCWLGTTSLSLLGSLLHFLTGRVASHSPHPGVSSLPVSQFFLQLLQFPENDTKLHSRTVIHIGKINIWLSFKLKFYPVFYIVSSLNNSLSSEWTYFIWEITCTHTQKVKEWREYTEKTSILVLLCHSEVLLHSEYFEGASSPQNGMKDINHNYHLKMKITKWKSSQPIYTAITEYHMRFL